jgi:signal-transduction protein with cAMP-binding, CBS, and nucleotidyltransferase domain
MEQIRRYLEKFSKQTDSDWEIFSARLSRQEFSKRALLLKTGQTEKYLSFIEKGIIRFYIPNEEKDLSFSFCF